MTWQFYWLKGEHRNKPQCFRSSGLDQEQKLTCSWDLAMPGFSDFGLIFSLGFGLASLPALKNFMVAAACLRMQSLLQYTESGWATLKQPGPMHLDAPGASITYRLKWSEFKHPRGNHRNTFSTHRVQLWLLGTYTTASLKTAFIHDTTNNPYRCKDFTLVTNTSFSKQVVLAKRVMFSSY